MIASANLWAEVRELSAWAAAPRAASQVSDFIDDLADWLSFCSLHQGTHQHTMQHSGLAETNSGPQNSSASLRRVLLTELGRPEMQQLMGKVSVLVGACQMRS